MKSIITYERVMLTLIVGLLAANLFSEDKATQPQREPGAMPAEFASWRGNSNGQFVMVPVNPDGSINVRVKEAALTEVSIRDISTDDELRVEIKDKIQAEIHEKVKVVVVGSEWNALRNAGPIEVVK
jgi:hypothetical protein